MKVVVTVVALLANLCFLRETYAFSYAYAFHTPLLPNSSYRVDQDFEQYNYDYRKYHLGEDWNRISSQNCNSDYGDPVYSVANGLVMYAQNAGSSWGECCNHSPHLARCNGC